MIDVEQLEATREVKDVLVVNKMTEQHGRAPTSRQVHVLVAVPHIYDPAAKYSLLDEEVVPRWTGGSPLLQLADQDVLWYGMKGSVGRGEGIDLRDERTLSRSALTTDIINRLEEKHVVLVKSPPMTGKTSLATLVSRALVHQHEENKRKAVVFNFSALGMSMEGKTFDQLFVEYCKVKWEYATVTLPASDYVGALFGSPGFIDVIIRGYDDFWGVELLREANNLAERIERFSPGGHYSSLGLTDFCLIDFRCVGSIDESVMERIAADMGLCEKLFVVCYDARMTGVKVFNSVMKIVYQVDFR
ncbi:hypothetical protein PR002_g13515 [Phytophthora rubi]|uniref:Uncharacterized protein n=1 Tax=Phytophthora rubi TaxID=129364 RepID=A0A6A3LGC8_9STRA|nr:hypothetical protein PR002_g13515 [Phytophthora rubi]